MNEVDAGAGELGQRGGVPERLRVRFVLTLPCVHETAGAEGAWARVGMTEPGGHALTQFASTRRNLERVRSLTLSYSTP